MPSSSVRFLVVSVALHGAAFAAVAAAFPSSSAPHEVSVGIHCTFARTLDALDPPEPDPIACGGCRISDDDWAPSAPHDAFDLPAAAPPEVFVDAPADAAGADDPVPWPFGVEARLAAGRNERFGSANAPGDGAETGTDASASADPAPAGSCAAAPPTATSAPARILETVTPAYPEAARTAGDEGLVLLDGEVLADGSVGEVAVVRSSGSAVLDRAALAAVRRWRFAAALEEGVAVRSVLRLPPIRFRLD